MASKYDNISYNQLVLGNNITDSQKPSLKQNKVSLSDSPSTPFSVLQAELGQDEKELFSTTAPRTTLFPPIFHQPFPTFDSDANAYLSLSPPSLLNEDQQQQPLESDFEARISMCEKEMEQVRKQVDLLSKRIVTIDMVMNNQTTCEQITSNNNNTEDYSSLVDSKQSAATTSQRGDDPSFYSNNNTTSHCIKSVKHYHHNDLDSANEQSDDSRDSLSSDSSVASPNDFNYFSSSYRRQYNGNKNNSDYNYTDDDMRDYTNTSISSNESLAGMGNNTDKYDSKKEEFKNIAHNNGAFLKTTEERRQQRNVGLLDKLVSTDDDNNTVDTFY